MRPDEELKELLNQCERLAILNSGVGSAQKREMTGDVFSWFGGIGMILAERWNSKRYTIRGQELYEVLLSRESHKIRPDQWESALMTYYAPPSPGEDKHFRFLLRTAVPDQYIVNWAELGRFWSSGLVDAMMVLYGRLGGSKDLRPPSGRDELAWCQWLSIQSKSAKNYAEQLGVAGPTLPDAPPGSPGLGESYDPDYGSVASLNPAVHGLVEKERLNAFTEWRRRLPWLRRIFAKFDPNRSDYSG